MDKILITNERLAEVLNTDDALEAFSRAAANGQVRLVIDILADIIPTILEMNKASLTTSHEIEEAITKRVENSDTVVADAPIKPSKKVVSGQTES